MRSSRVIAVAAVAVLAAMVVTAVALAASGPSTPTVTAASVAVGPGAPTTATGVLTYASSQGISVSADWSVDFATDAADVTATASLSIVTATLEARLADRTLYLYLPQFSSLIGAPWATTGALRGPAELDPLATVLRHPDLARLHPEHRVTVTTATGATTTMTFRDVHLPSTAGLPITLPRVAQVTAVVRTGTEGQLLSLGVRLVGTDQTVRLGLLLTGYNVPVTVTAPPPGDVVTLTPSKERAIFGTNTASIAHELRSLRRVLDGQR